MLGRFFELEKRQTNIRTEVVAGLTTFLTMAYIILVNPNILSDQTGMNKEALIAVTCIVTAAATIATGLLANAPHSHGAGDGSQQLLCRSRGFGENGSSRCFRCCFWHLINYRRFSNTYKHC